MKQISRACLGAAVLILPSLATATATDNMWLIDPPDRESGSVTRAESEVRMTALVRRNFEDGTFTFVFWPTIAAGRSVEDYLTQFSEHASQSPWVRRQPGPIVEFRGPVRFEFNDLPGKVAMELYARILSDGLTLADGKRVDFLHAVLTSFAYPQNDAIARAALDLFNDKASEWCATPLGNSPDPK